MGSSVIGIFLPKSLIAPKRARLVAGLLLLSAVWGRGLPGQASVSGRSPDSPELPRFTLRQIVIGRNDSLIRLPGAWLRAAVRTRSDSVTGQAYITAAHRSGLTPLQGNALTSERSQHVMGLYRRSEMLDASRRTLESIRDAIPGDTTRAQFDRIFRPRGEWIVDIHDAALAFARQRDPGIKWESARRGLTAAHWIPQDDSLSTSEALPRALYGLAVLAATDSSAFAAALADLRSADSASAAPVRNLLQGYTESQRWYAEALDFFLSQPWAPDSSGAGRSIRDYVADAWGNQPNSGKADLALPEIQTRWFGYPQAVPHYGIPGSLFRHLIKNENGSASEWLDNHGQPGLLRALRRLPPGDTSLTLLRSGSETLRLTTVPRQSRESLNGFLEPQDAIAIDPGYSPLLALGAVIHEWQHLIFRHRQLEAFARRHIGPWPSSVAIPGIQPYLAEGFAEWSTERILHPLVLRWPLLGLGELEKRTGLAQGPGDDEHVTGYALVRALAAALPSPAATTDLLLRYPEDPSGIAAEPGLRQKWGAYRQAQDRQIAVPGPKLLIPEVTFTIEDGFPDVLATRILVPVDSHGRP